MIQLNLLPDVKQEFIKTRRRRRSVMGIAGIISLASLGLVAFLFLTANVWQGRQINGLDEDISASREKIESTQDVTRILTVQNQLDSLDDLHLNKSATSRLFSYLEAIVPSDVSVSSVDLSHEDLRIELTGISTSFEQVNRLVDTLKFTDYSRRVDEQVDGARAFSEVVIDNSAPVDSGVTFTVSALYDPVLFDNSLEGDQIGIVVPEITTTRSTTERPGDLFDSSQTEEVQQ